ncbi:MAG: hypothetical protein ACK5Y6_10425 [Pseudomonadota bacterium]|jgi:hypothetical protein
MESVKPVVLFSLVPITTGQLELLPRQSITRGWFGESLERPAKFCIALDPDRLWFLFQHPNSPLNTPLHNKGEFVEGLHTYDVGELFMMDEKGDYVEFNVSGDGAWWHMSFDGYRSRRKVVRCKRFSALEVKDAGDGWVACLAFERKELDIVVGRETRFQVAGYIYNGGQPTYLTTAGRPDYEPDFHTERSFQLADWREIL